MSWHTYRAEMKPGQGHKLRPATWLDTQVHDLPTLHEPCILQGTDWVWQTDRWPDPSEKITDPITGDPVSTLSQRSMEGVVSGHTHAFYIILQSRQSLHKASCEPPSGRPWRGRPSAVHASVWCGVIVPASLMHMGSVDSPSDARGS